MYYSVTFEGPGNASRNTWDDWKLKPESPPVVPLPKPKTNYVDIPGRTMGPLDLTSVPFGRVTYERITGSWRFAINDDYWYTPNRTQIFDDMRSFLQGRLLHITLEEDSEHYFAGRITLDPPNSGAGPFVVTVNFDFEPVRYNADDGTVDITWLPDADEWLDVVDPTLSTVTTITDPEIHALFT